MADSSTTSQPNLAQELTQRPTKPQPGDGSYLIHFQAQPSVKPRSGRGGRGLQNTSQSQPQPGEGAYLARSNQIQRSTYQSSSRQPPPPPSSSSDMVVIEELNAHPHSKTSNPPSRPRHFNTSPSMRRFEFETRHSNSDASSSNSNAPNAANNTGHIDSPKERWHLKQRRAAKGLAENVAENVRDGVGHIEEGVEKGLGLKPLDPTTKEFIPAVNGASGTSDSRLLHQRVEESTSETVTAADGQGDRVAKSQWRKNHKRKNNRHKKHNAQSGDKVGNDQSQDLDHSETHAGSSFPAPTGPPPKQISSRRAAFDRQARLTDAGPSVALRKTVSDQLHDYRATHACAQRDKEADDLNSRLTRELSRKPYFECPICYNPILPSQQIWSCLPSTQPFRIPTPSSGPTSFSDSEIATMTTSYYSACYTPFHIRCIRDWANRSLQEDAERAAANDQVGQVTPTWRCPGCQKKREDKVGGYRCFCGRLANPGSGVGGASGAGSSAGAGHHIGGGQGATGPVTGDLPHSCNEACARPRVHCDHACPLNCHPGPCPPCQVALVVPCPSHHTSITVKCAATSHSSTGGGPVCDEICSKQLGCGNRSHLCPLPCHFGPCPPCEEIETARCYCGEEEKVVPCGWGTKDGKICLSENGAERWVGRFKCERPCGRLYDCAIHSCKDHCHPHPSHPQHCPTSPDQITNCACGSTPLDLLPNYPQRSKCTDPIPTCERPCPKLRACGHPCPRTCHDGPCPTCTEEVVRPCRCGESMIVLPCEQVERAAQLATANGEAEREQGMKLTQVLCERVCKALRNCGRHECGRVCCPLSYRAKGKNKQKTHSVIDVEDDDLHTCPLVCGKMLSCGLHACPKPDHKGVCGRCLQASYDELICHCGHTIIYPPVACGTTINCLYPCARDPPPCGHPKTQHNCHETPNCPPCPYLTSKPCACGKEREVKNVRCSQTVVSCGQPCGQLLSCGYHKCEKSCHRPGDCGDCNQQCGKPKRACGHPCTSACHAPARCPESDPCQAIVRQTCPCGRRQQTTSCGASIVRSESREKVRLECDSECQRRQRNAKLADALGLSDVEKRGQVEWSHDLKSYAEGPNGGFVKTVEGAFKDFINSTKQTQILPHMPPARREFVKSLAEMYRLSANLIDAEPNRSVQIHRRPESRIPTPLLSAAVTVRTPTVGQGGSGSSGGLTNLRSGGTASIGSGGASDPGPWRRMANGISSAASSQPNTRPVTPATTTSSPNPASVTSSPWTSNLRNVTARSSSGIPSRNLTPAPPVPVSAQAQAQHAVIQGLVGDDGDDWDKSGDEM